MQVRQSDRCAQLPANRGLREGLRPIQHRRPLHSDRQDPTLRSSVVDPHCFVPDPDPDPIFHFDAESGSGTYLKCENEESLLLLFIAMSVYIVNLSHQCQTVGVIKLSVLWASILKFSGKSRGYLYIWIKWIQIQIWIRTDMSCMPLLIRIR